MKEHLELFLLNPSSQFLGERIRLSQLGSLAMARGFKISLNLIMVGGEPNHGSQFSYWSKSDSFLVKKVTPMFTVLIILIYNILEESFKNAIFYQEPYMLHISL